MHENGYFLSYRKPRHDAENPAHNMLPTSLWGVAAKWLVTTGDLEKFPVRIAKKEAPTREGK